MADPTMQRHDDVFVISFGDDENVTTEQWGVTMTALLDEVDAVDGAKAIVTTGGAKHYSNGLDVPHMAELDADGVAAYVGRVCQVVYRLMLNNAPTVAAVNGHAFGLGAFLVLAHDHTVMREDRGYWNLPEVHLAMSFPRNLMSIIEATLDPSVRRRAVAAGHRYPGPEAVAAGIVDQTCALPELLDTAVQRAQALAPTAGANLGRIKRQLYPEVAGFLTERSG